MGEQTTAEQEVETVQRYFRLRYDRFVTREEVLTGLMPVALRAAAWLAQHAPAAEAVWASVEEIEQQRGYEAYLDEEQHRAWEQEQEDERHPDPLDKMSDFYYTDEAQQMRRDAGLE